LRRKRNPKYISIRQRYQAKRQGKIFKAARKARIRHWKQYGTFFKPLDPKSLEVINLVAPTNFSFINNTQEVLGYIRRGRDILKYRKSILFDISKIQVLTPDVIPLLISHIKDVNFTNNIPINGNGPANENFRKIFTESGFYNHVRSKNKFKTSENNIMHRESNFKVMPEIAGEAVNMIITKRAFDETYIEALYNIFIELMSNTHHHANLKKFGTSKWWLYLYVDPSTMEISISFLDLGVGIFKSLIVKSYLKRLGKNIKLVDNGSLVKDLLEGNIQSRIEHDREIRGKGIPQIIKYASLECFDDFYLITNDVKIDLKRNTWEKMNESLVGTFYYIRLKNSITNE